VAFGRSDVGNDDSSQLHEMMTAHSYMKWWQLTATWNSEVQRT